MRRASTAATPRAASVESMVTVNGVDDDYSPFSPPCGAPPPFHPAVHSHLGRLQHQRHIMDTAMAGGLHNIHWPCSSGRSRTSSFSHTSNAGCKLVPNGSVGAAVIVAFLATPKVNASERKRKRDQHKAYCVAATTTVAKPQTICFFSLNRTTPRPERWQQSLLFGVVLRRPSISRSRQVTEDAGGTTRRTHTARC